MKRVGLITLLAALAVAPLVPATAQELHWTRQIGTSQFDRGTGVAVDSGGNAYICGWTEGDLAGLRIGPRDVFLAKYNASGALVWTRKLGSPSGAWGSDVALDGQGNAYLTGWSAGSIGGPNAGDADAFLVKYDAAGTVLWKRQFGTVEYDLAWAVAVDSAGSAFVTGDTNGPLGGTSVGSPDAFLVKYGASGVLLWKRQIGGNLGTHGYGVAVDGAGSAYVTGRTSDDLGGPSAGKDDMFLVKYDASGTLLWKRQLGSQWKDQGTSVAVDDLGGVYVAGRTQGTLGATGLAGDDVFLAKYDASGTLLWIGQEGTEREDRGFGVAVDGAGNAYVTGFTERSLGGPSAGGSDIFLLKYNASGTLLWKRQAGTSEDEVAWDVAVDSTGNAHIVGGTFGGLGGPNAGFEDVFLTKYGIVCYADCDKSTGKGVLDIFDFLCWQGHFVIGNAYACDCDTSTGVGVCDVFDFLCFQNAFVGGCP
jgi:Beta-propeller repeat